MNTLPLRLASAALGYALMVTAVAGSGADVSPAPVESMTYGSPNRQPLLHGLYLPAVTRQEPADFMPRPAAPLGQAIRDIEWHDGMLYAAMGSHIVSFKEEGGALKPVEVSDALTGIVYDIEAAGDVVYAAHLRVPTDAEPEDSPGGLTALAAGEASALRVVSRVVLDGAEGYAGLAVSGDTVATLPCRRSETWELVCDSIEAIDIQDPSRPRVRGSVFSGHNPDFTPALVAFGGSRVTDGKTVVDVSGDGPPVTVDQIGSRSDKPLAAVEQLVTYDGDEVTLFQTSGPEPVEVDTVSLDSLGLSHGVTAGAMDAGGVMLSGPREDPSDHPIAGSLWAWVPVSPLGFGAPVAGTNDWNDRALALHDGELWHAMSSGLLAPQGLQPFMPSIRSEALDENGSPAGTVVDRWTGWNWATLDVWTADDRAYALAPADGAWRSDPVDLLVFDITEPRVPTLMGFAPDVCPGAESDAGVMHDPFIDPEEPHGSLESCSVASLRPGSLLVSSVEGASEVSVANPAFPLVVRTGPSLGTQLESAREGLYALRDHVVSPRHTSLVLYDTTGDWPVERWSKDIGTAYKLAVDASGDRSFLGLIGLHEYPIHMQAGWIGPADFTPALAYMEDDSFPLTWMPPSMLAADGSVIVARIDGDSDRSHAPRSATLGGPNAVEPEPALHSYRRSDGGFQLEWSVPLLAADARGLTSALVGGQVLLGHYVSLESFALRADRSPIRLGSIPHAVGVLSSDYLRDGDYGHRLVPVGSNHAYFTGNPAGQVLEVPPLR